MDIILKLVFTALFSARALFLFAKTMRHKQMAQLDFFDYINGITEAKGNYAFEVCEHDANYIVRKLCKDIEH